MSSAPHVSHHGDEHDHLSVMNRRTMIMAGAGFAASASLASHFSVGAQESSPIASPAPGGASVDPQMQEVLDALVSFDAPPLETVTPDVARNLPSFADAVQQVLASRGKPGQEPVGDIKHILIPGLDDNQILARLYYPRDAGMELLPVLVYFHGGGFVIANLNTYDASCRALANGAGCLVASIAYRLAPENPFPAAVDDAYAATQFFLSGAGVSGGDPDRVAVAGESAGGSLATAVAIRARDEGAPLPIHQVLIYPYVSLNPTTGDAAASVTQYATAKPLGAAALPWFSQYYSPDNAALTSPLGSPLAANADLTGLPPATVISAQIDPLQSQGKLYADALKAAGVDVTWSIYEGVTHEFFGMGAVVDKAAEAVAEVTARLTAAFGG